MSREPPIILHTGHTTKCVYKNNYTNYGSVRRYQHLKHERSTDADTNLGRKTSENTNLPIAIKLPNVNSKANLMGLANTISDCKRDVKC